MKKNKFKILGFSSLALLMACTGVIAFAPLSTTNAEENLTTTTGLGLDPKNDPVIYTTESGLEIKYGGATMALGGGNETGDFLADLESGALKGYPYFTMGTYNGNYVNWVIIGKSTSGIPTSNLNKHSISYEKLAVWQTKLAESPTYKTWFENYFETYSPAGSLVENHGVLNDITARNLIEIIQVSLLSSLPSKAEIDTGCVLAISECCLGTSATYYYYNSSALRTAMQNLFNTNLNLSDAQKEMIVYQDDLKASADCYNSQIFTYEDYFFPLSWYQNDNFSIQDFLPSENNPDGPIPLRVSYDITTGVACNYWLSDAASLRSYSNRLVCGILASGASDGGVADTVAKGVRPACVVKFS